MQKVSSALLVVMFCFGCDAVQKSAEFALRRFRISSPSMAPTLEVGANISVLSADSFRVNQIIAFHPPSKYFAGLDSTSLWVCRLVGKPGDTLRMEKGRLVRNNKFYQFPLVLKHSYLVKTKMALNEKRLESFEHEQFGPDIYRFFLCPDEVPLLRKNSAIETIESMVMETGDMDSNDQLFVFGNRDNWDPIIVPTESYFVLGDNRHNALDSRYLGFIPARNVEGFVVKN